MSKKIVKFIAEKPVQQPTVVRFHTKDGKTVTFKATETVMKPVPVKFIAKDKKK